MLKLAERKAIYRRTILADLTQPLINIPDGAYGGVISCGTFTHGHLGPECFPSLFRITRPDALFVCGTIAPVLDGMGFGSALAQLAADNQITPVPAIVASLWFSSSLKTKRAAPIWTAPCIF